MVSRKVFTPEFVCADASIISPHPVGVAKVPSPRRNVVVLFGGVGTHHHTVAVIVATLPVAIGVENVCTQVKVLAASVLAKSASVHAVLNCASVPVIPTIEV